MIAIYPKCHRCEARDWYQGDCTYKSLMDLASEQGWVWHPVEGRRIQWLCGACVREGVARRRRNAR